MPPPSCFANCVHSCLWWAASRCAAGPIPPAARFSFLLAWSSLQPPSAAHVWPCGHHGCTAEHQCKAGSPECCPRKSRVRNHTQKVSSRGWAPGEMVAILSSVSSTAETAFKERAPLLHKLCPNLMLAPGPKACHSVPAILKPENPGFLRQCPSLTFVSS